jgi:hypothetical protein
VTRADSGSTTSEAADVGLWRSATDSQLMADRRFRGKADILRSGPVYGRLEVCYPFGRKHAREHMFDWLARR